MKIMRFNHRSLLPTLLLVLPQLGCPTAREAPETPYRSGVATRIDRIENALLQPAQSAGQPVWSLANRMAHYSVPGVSIAVIENFDLAWAKGYGVADAETGVPVTKETLFQAGSISKPVTALAVLKLVQEGSCSLDTPVNDILRTWRLPDNELTRKTPVILRHLLSHTGGITVHGFPGYSVAERLPSLAQVLEGEPLANTAPIRVDVPPGAQFRYSGGGFTIVQQALIDLEGKSFPEIMEETVLRPLGMNDSTYEQPLPPYRLQFAAAGHRGDGSPVTGRRHTYPEMAAAGLWATPSDLARFAIGVQRALRGKGDTLLSSEGASEMVTPVMDNVGLGIFVERRGDSTYFQHGGSNEGFRAALIAHRDQGYGAVVMTNSDNGGELAEEIVRAIAREYRWDGY